MRPALFGVIEESGRWRKGPAKLGVLGEVALLSYSRSGAEPRGRIARPPFCTKICKADVSSVWTGP